LSLLDEIDSKKSILLRTGVVITKYYNWQLFLKLNF